MGRDGTSSPKSETFIVTPSKGRPLVDVASCGDVGVTSGCIRTDAPAPTVVVCADDASSAAFASRPRPAPIHGYVGYVDVEGVTTPRGRTDVDVRPPAALAKDNVEVTAVVGLSAADDVTGVRVSPPRWTCS